MELKYNDGGRKEAGFKGKTNDCVVRAIAIASEQPYIKVYNKLENLNTLCSKHSWSRVAKKLQSSGSSPRNGTFKKVYDNYIKSLGFVWKPCMTIGSGCKVHLRKEELPTGRIICRLSRHLVAVVDGVLNDTYDCSRNGTRCVYGYYYKPEGGSNEVLGI